MVFMLFTVFSLTVAPGGRRRCGSCCVLTSCSMALGTSALPLLWFPESSSPIETLLLLLARVWGCFEVQEVSLSLAVLGLISSSSVMTGNLDLLLVNGDEMSFVKCCLSLVSCSVAFLSILLVSGTRIRRNSGRGTEFVNGVEVTGDDWEAHALLSGSLGGSTLTGFLGASLKSLLRKSRQYGRGHCRNWGGTSVPDGSDDVAESVEHSVSGVVRSSS